MTVVWFTFLLVVGVVVGTTQLAKELAIMVNKCELAESKALEYALLLQVSWITSLLFLLESDRSLSFLFSLFFCSLSWNSWPRSHRIQSRISQLRRESGTILKTSLRKLRRLPQPSSRGNCSCSPLPSSQRTKKNKPPLWGALQSQQGSLFLEIYFSLILFIFCFTEEFRWRNRTTRKQRVAREWRLPLPEVLAIHSMPKASEYGHGAPRSKTAPAKLMSAASYGGTGHVVAPIVLLNGSAAFGTGLGNSLEQPRVDVLELVAGQALVKGTPVKEAAEMATLMALDNHPQFWVVDLGRQLQWSRANQHHLAPNINKEEEEEEKNQPGLPSNSVRYKHGSSHVDEGSSPCGVPRAWPRLLPSRPHIECQGPAFCCSACQGRGHPVLFAPL